MRDHHFPDPGSYKSDSPNLNFDPLQFLNPNVLLAGLGLSAGSPHDCNVFYCAGTNPTTGPVDNLKGVVGVLLGNVK